VFFAGAALKVNSRLVASLGTKAQAAANFTRFASPPKICANSAAPFRISADSARFRAEYL